MPQNPFKWGMFTLRPREHEDDGEEDWWFASTAIPWVFHSFNACFDKAHTSQHSLLAATIGPLANVLSIAALVVYWRENLLPGGDDACDSFNGDTSMLLPQTQGNSYRDPSWYGF